MVVLEGVPRTATFAEVHARAMEEGAVRAATRRAPHVVGVTPLGEAVAHHFVVDGAPAGAAAETDGFGALRPAARIDLVLAAAPPRALDGHQAAHLGALRARTARDRASGARGGR